MARRKKSRRSKAHPGFSAVAGRIARKQGISKKRASAILAASSRRASPAAKRKNPRLKRVAMPKKRSAPKRRRRY